MGEGFFNVAAGLAFAEATFLHGRQTSGVHTAMGTGGWVLDSAPNPRAAARQLIFFISGRRNSCNSSSLGS
jgi:hypothetical protein